MADPDIRRMGKKHKKHKKDYSQYHNIRLPGFLPERVPMPEEPVNEMKVVLKLPRPMENHNGRLRFTPPIITHPRHSHNVHHNISRGSGLAIPPPPRELIVSIPFTALCQEEEEEEEEPIEQLETEPVAAIAVLEEEEPPRHSSHHKHKKHKKHKKHHHHRHHHDHDSAPPPPPQEEVIGQFGDPEMGVYPDVIKHEPPSSLHMTQYAATKTVAPLKIQVPKPSPPVDTSSNRTSSKHRPHSHSHTRHEEKLSESHSRSQPQTFQSGSLFPGVIPSGKHMHTTTTTTTTTTAHKHHHHKHKEKRHHHRNSGGYQRDEHVIGYHGNEDVIGGGGRDGDDDDDDDLNEQGHAVVMRIAPPTRLPGGKPTSFMKTAEEKKTFTSDEHSPVGEKLQTSSHEGHKHHKKKKKKHHKHSKQHSFSHSEPEISPPISRLSGMESEDSQQGYFATTPLSTGSRNTTTAQVHAPPTVAIQIPQDVPVSTREPALTRSPSKDNKKLIQAEASGVVDSSVRETRRLSQDSSGGSSSSTRLPLRRLSRDKRMSKFEAQSPDVVQPPPSKRSRMDDEKPPPPPSLKFDISQAKGLNIEPRDTPSPPVSMGSQFQPSLRHQTSHGSSDSVTSTPVTASKPSLGEARRSSTGAGAGGERAQQSISAAVASSPPVLQNQAEMKTPQVRLSKDTLQLFLKNLHHLIQRRDPDGIFAEPVTDDIAPGYSALISIPMDLTTIAKKIDMGQYEAIGDFKSDFILMCNNAMTYNAPETVYYASAKRLLTTGLQIIAKETSLRSDIRHGTTALIPSRSVSPAPLPLDAHIPTPPVNMKVDYSSPFLCRIDLSLLRGTSGAITRSVGGPGLMMGGVVGGVTLPLPEQPECISVDVNGLSDITNQSHLTKVVIGCGDDMTVATAAVAAAGGEDEIEPEEDVFSSLAPESPEEILAQVEEAAEVMKENLDASRPNVKFTFFNQDESGKTMLNILNPDTGSVDVSSPLDLTTLNDFVRMGNNAATVLKTELPLMRATPVSYLMYGPFGSFAPAYDSSFATLTKMDSDLLLQSYGSELGVSYAHSLQQFVKGAGSFVTEMADAVLNGLTTNRHSKFMAKFREFEEGERKLRETPTSTSSSTGTTSLSRKGSRDETEKSPTSAKEREASTPSVEGNDEASNSEGEVVNKDDGSSSPEQQMDTSEPPPPQDSNSKQQESIISEDSRGSPTTLSSTEEGARGEGGGGEGEGEMREMSSSSLSREASSGVSDQVSLGGRSTSSSTPATPTPPLPLPLPLPDAAAAATATGTEPMEEEETERGKGGVVGDDDELDDEAAILLRDLEDIGSLGSSSGEGAPVVSRASSESNSRLMSPASVEPLQRQGSSDAAPLNTDIDSQLEHTSHLLDQLQEEQRDRLGQAPLELDDGHLALPGPSDEEVRIASDLRVGLAQLTAQARPRDVVSVPALHDAMGISIETVDPGEEGEGDEGDGDGNGDGEEIKETDKMETEMELTQQHEQVESTQTTATPTTVAMTSNNEIERPNQQ